MDRIAPNELEKRVDEVLFYIWDPIGVNDMPNARAEYRSYVSSVLSYVQQNKSIEEIADLLLRIEGESMELPTNRKHALKIAKLLVRHKEAIEAGRA